MNKPITKTELLAPAGSIDAFYQALNNGADAIYMGGANFGARAFAGNFTDDEIMACVNHAHLYGRKVYITVNTLISDSNTNEFLKYIAFLNDICVDAVIVQDLGMATLIYKKFPDLTLHASTQLHNHNISSLEFLEDMDFKRAVLARECHISEIAKPTKIEKEVFIHGALCISYSGQCLFSALTNRRSGNQGTCSQNCRMRYELHKKENIEMVKQQTDGDFLLSPMDLGVLENLSKLLDLSITSLKIEGRMKSPEYVGYVTKIYRGLIDDYYAGKTLSISDEQKDNLSKLFNRGYTKGYAFGSFGNSMMSSVRPNHKGVKIGDITKITHNKINIKLTGNLHQHDGIKFEESDRGFTCERIYKDGLLVSSAKPGDYIQLDNKDHLNRKEAVLKTRDHLQCEMLAKVSTHKVPISIVVNAKINQPLTVEFISGVKAVLLSGNAVSTAKSAPITVEQIETQLKKLGNTAFECKDISIKSDKNIFIAKSELNEIRRTLSEMLTSALTMRDKGVVVDLAKTASSKVAYDNEFGYSVFVRNSKQLKATVGFNIKRIYTDNEKLFLSNKSKISNLFYSIPRVNNENNIQSNENLLIGDTSGLHNNAADNTIICDYHVNAINAHSLNALYSKNVSCITISPEMTFDDVDKMIKKYSSTFGFLPNLELIVYGKYELMLIKNCIIASSLKTKKGCDLCKNDDYYLLDVHQNIYPIKTSSDCINTIYSSKNANIMPSKIKQYLDLSISSFRISLLDEDYDQTIKIFNMYFNV